PGVSVGFLQTAGHDSKTRPGRLPALLTQEGPQDRQAPESGHFSKPGRRREARARRPILQAPVASAGEALDLSEAARRGARSRDPRRAIRHARASRTTPLQRSLPSRRGSGGGNRAKGRISRGSRLRRAPSWNRERTSLGFQPTLSKKAMPLAGANLNGALSSKPRMLLSIS